MEKVVDAVVGATNHEAVRLIAAVLWADVGAVEVQGPSVGA